MRYQERIYEQTPYEGIRNKAVNNVNTSSDLCVFVSPVFVMSGASKLVCTGCCPEGYVLDMDGLSCTKITVTAATYHGSGSTIVAGNIDFTYGLYGGYFYPSIQDQPNLPVTYTGNSGILVDQLMNVVPPLTIVTGTALWGTGSTDTGRLNAVGISASTTEYLGFSKCVDISIAGTYYIGIAADNYSTFSVNNIEYVNFNNPFAGDNWKTWSIFQFELLSGINIIEMKGKNLDGPTAFGVEIYNPTSFEVLTGSTTTGTTGIIFSSAEMRGNVFDVGDTIGYSCPSGFTVNKCAMPVNCVEIEKLPCVGSGSGATVNIVTTATTIPVTFDFTGHTDTFSADSTSFKYEIYKFDPDLNFFTLPAKYKSEVISYSAFSGTNELQQNVPVSDLELDGDYVIKGYYESPTCTDFLRRLGKKIDTSAYKLGSQYQLYNDATDYFFTAIAQPDKPYFLSNVNANFLNPAPLFQDVIFIDAEDGPTNMFEVVNSFTGDLLITVNGALLAKGEDYTYTGTTVVLNDLVSSLDVVTAIYNRVGGINIVGESFNILSITSGATNTQGNNRIFFNTTTSKYEIYTSAIPVSGSNMILTINGVTLANGVDYYVSTTNPKRVILEGTIIIGDLITLVYYPQASIVNGVTASNMVIVWGVNTAPTMHNGEFVIELSPINDFSSITYTASTPYQINVGTYSGILQVTGSVGSKYFYRVKNDKKFESICGEVQSIAYSEVIPITVTSNSINSY
jgi:hypothetical protein